MNSAVRGEVVVDCTMEIATLPILVHDLGKVALVRVESTALLGLNSATREGYDQFMSQKESTPSLRNGMCAVDLRWLIVWYATLLPGR